LIVVFIAKCHAILVRKWLCHHD